MPERMACRRLTLAPVRIGELAAARYRRADAGGRWPPEKSGWTDFEDFGCGLDHFDDALGHLRRTAEREAVHAQRRPTAGPCARTVIGSGSAQRQLARRAEFQRFASRPEGRNGKGRGPVDPQARASSSCE